MYSRKILILIGGKEVGRVPRVVIGEPIRGKGICLLHCDKNWNLISYDGDLNSVTQAKRRAELMYPGVTQTWVKATVSKREARAVERKEWEGHECSFCNRIPPEFQSSIKSKKTVICNVCADEIYQDFLESEEVSSVTLPRGDYYPQNGFDHIATYVSRLLVPTKESKFMHIFALDGMRGFGMIAIGPVIEVSFVVEPHHPLSSRENKIRAFFASQGRPPARDYLANNGRTRILQFPVNGNSVELTETTRTILTELCDVLETEPLIIRYGERENQA